MKVVFLDRDGTIDVGVPKYERVDSLDKVEILPHVMEALTELAQLDYGVIIITNQAGISEGLIDMDEFHAINNKVLELIAPSGVKVLKTYLCPHGEADKCACRKPQPTLLLEAAKEFDIDLSHSWMIGDRPSDVETGANAGTKTILVLSGVPTVQSDKATYTAKDLLEAVYYIADQEAGNVTSPLL